MMLIIKFKDFEDYPIEKKIGFAECFEVILEQTKRVLKFPAVEVADSFTIVTHWKDGIKSIYKVEFSADVTAVYINNIKQISDVEYDTISAAREAVENINNRN